MTNPLTSLSAPGSLYPAFRGVIIRSHTHPGGTPKMLFDVLPTSGNVSGTGENGAFPSLPLLQAGFGDPQNSEVKTGMIFVPSVGSRVVCIHDGVGYIIAGFLSGPVLSSSSGTLNGDYNPGIAQAYDRTNRTLPTDANIPELFGLYEGEMGLLSSQGSVKACVWGALIGSHAGCVELFVYESGQIIRRALGHVTREQGFFESCVSSPIDPQVLAAWKEGLTDTPPDRVATTHTQIFTGTPLVGTKKPYLLQQRGHVPRALMADGLSAIKAAYGGTDVETDGHAVARDAVVVPKVVNTEAVADELTTDSFEVYDRQVDSDGSWRLKAGNSKGTPGAWTPDNEKAEMTLAYDAKTKVLTLNMGPGKVKVSANGDTGDVKVESSARVDVKAKEAITAEVGRTKAVLTPSSAKLQSNVVTIQAPSITLDGMVRVTQTLHADVDVTAGAKRTSLTTHTHTEGGSGAPG